MLLSIIVPCLDGEDFLPNSLESALAQTHHQIEIILVDNNSTDSTWRIMLQYQKRYPHLISCYQERKPGAPAARNKGLQVAKGRWIQFLDADDLLLPEKLGHQQRLIADLDEAVLVAGAYIFQDGTAKTTRFPLKGNPWLALVRGQLGITSSNLWSRSHLLLVNGWTEAQRSSQEYELMFKMLTNAGQVILDQQPLTIVRRRPNSISTSDIQGNRQRAAHLHLQIFEYILQNQPEVVDRDRLDFCHSVLKHIAVLGLFEPKRADQYYEAWIPKDFFIRDPNFGRFYQLIYNVYGFQMAQRLYKRYIALRRLLQGVK